MRALSRWSKTHQLYETVFISIVLAALSRLTVVEIEQEETARRTSNALRNQCRANNSPVNLAALEWSPHRGRRPAGWQYYYCVCS